jgi:hypothetical protein
MPTQGGLFFTAYKHDHLSHTVFVHVLNILWSRRIWYNLRRKCRLHRLAPKNPIPEVSDQWPVQYAFKKLWSFTDFYKIKCRLSF